ncbi:hypothetical protein H3C66_01835 [Patescibacteria group bacterium]|nr:hypothetical protein [Patescibacteria group bacterium]
MHGFHRPIVIEPIVSSTDTSFFADAAGAFFGAFFAFMFGLVAYYVQKKLDRYHKHKNSVVELEHLLQEHFDISSGNQYLLKGAIETINKGAFNFTILTPFRLPEDITLRFGNLELLNKYMPYSTSVTKLNHGMATWGKMVDQLHQAAIAGALSPEAKKANQNHLKAQATDLIRFLLGLDQETKELVAYVRVFLRKEKNIWSIPFIEKAGKPIVSKEEIVLEKKKLEEEMEEIGEESRKQIDEIKNIKVDLNEK